MKKQDHLATLNRWAEWGSATALVHTPRPDWSAVDALINAAKPALLENARYLRELLERSFAQLRLSDPFLCDLGVSRWLDDENSYSNWLAWALEQLGDADLILDVLGVRRTDFAAVCVGQKVRVQREVQVKEGLPESPGRIDLLISFGDPPRALLGVEVKIFDEQHWKQEGYVKSLGQVPCDVAPACVLLAIDDVPVRQRFGFQLRLWEDVSLALRRAIAHYAQNCDHIAIAAMMLAFVAAIEQNLLEIGTTAARRAWRSKPTLMPRDLVSYLKRTAETP